MESYPEAVEDHTEAVEDNPEAGEDNPEAVYDLLDTLMTGKIFLSAVGNNLWR